MLKIFDSKGVLFPYELDFISAKLYRSAFYENTVDFELPFSTLNIALCQSGNKVVADGDEYYMKDVSVVDNGQPKIQVHCEHISYKLSDVKLKKTFKYNSISLFQLLLEIMETAPIGFGLDWSADNEIFAKGTLRKVNFKPATIREALITVSKSYGIRLRFNGKRVYFDFAFVNKNTLSETVEDGKNLINISCTYNEINKVSEGSCEAVLKDTHSIIPADFLLIKNTRLDTQELMRVFSVSYNPIRYTHHTINFKQSLEEWGMNEDEESEDEDENEEEEKGSPRYVRIRAEGKKEDWEYVKKKESPLFTASFFWYLKTQVRDDIENANEDNVKGLKKASGDYFPPNEFLTKLDLEKYKKDVFIGDLILKEGQILSLVVDSLSKMLIARTSGLDICISPNGDAIKNAIEKEKKEQEEKLLKEVIDVEVVVTLTASPAYLKHYKNELPNLKWGHTDYRLNESRWIRLYNREKLIGQNLMIDIGTRPRKTEFLNLPKYERDPADGKIKEIDYTFEMAGYPLLRVEYLPHSIELKPTEKDPPEENPNNPPNPPNPPQQGGGGNIHIAKNRAEARAIAQKIEEGLIIILDRGQQ